MNMKGFKVLYYNYNVYEEKQRLYTRGGKWKKSKCLLSLCA